jgi:L-threonylcarbamoyladenylate synthase
MTTSRRRLTQDNFQKIVQDARTLISHGGIIVYPTDTVYGIGAHVLDTAAIERVFALKERDRGKPMLILADSLRMAERYTQNISPTAYRLLKKYWPGSVTFLFSANDVVPTVLTAGTGKIGIRVPDHAFCRALVSTVDAPIVSTSANIAGAGGATSIDKVALEFSGKVDLIIDGGDALSSSPSTVVDVTVDPPRVIRSGAVKINEEGVV